MRHVSSTMIMFSLFFVMFACSKDPTVVVLIATPTPILTEVPEMTFSLNTSPTAIPELSASDYDGKGLSFLNQGTYELAIDEFTKAINLAINPQENDPDTWKYYLHRGEAFLEFKLYIDAINDLDKSIELIPINISSAEAHNLKGKSLYHLEEYDEAIDEYNKAIILDSNKAIYYKNKANALYKLGDYEDSVNELNQSIELDFSDHETHALKGKIFILLNKYREAISAYSQAISYKPNSPEYFAERGNAIYLEGDPSTGISDFDKAIKLDPNYGMAYFYKANAYYTLNGFEMAINTYSKAIDVDPDSKNTYLYYWYKGRSEYTIWKDKAAIDSYTKSIESGDQQYGIAYGPVYGDRARAYKSLHKYDLAFSDCKKYLDYFGGPSKRFSCSWQGDLIDANKTYTGTANRW